MKCRILVPLRRIPLTDPALLESWHQPGDVWEAPPNEPSAAREQVLLYVRLGACEPADEECEKTHGLSARQLAEAQLGYRAIAAGVWPEDYELFRQGAIAGYDLDGNYLPGPNVAEFFPETNEEENETDE